jgi:hypothetical protein
MRNISKLFCVNMACKLQADAICHAREHGDTVSRYTVLSVYRDSLTAPAHAARQARQARQRLKYPMGHIADTAHEPAGVLPCSSSCARLQGVQPSVQDSSPVPQNVLA